MLMTGCSGGGSGGGGGEVATGGGGADVGGSPQPLVFSMPATMVLANFTGSSGGVAKIVYDTNGMMGNAGTGGGQPAQPAKQVLITSIDADGGNSINGLLADPSNLTILKRPLLVFDGTGIGINNKTLQHEGKTFGMAPGSIHQATQRGTNRTGLPERTIVYRAVLPDEKGKTGEGGEAIVLAHNNRRPIQFSIIGPPPTGLPQGRVSYSGYVGITRNTGSPFLSHAQSRFDMHVDFGREEVTGIHQQNNALGAVTTNPVSIVGMPDPIMIDMATGAFRGGINFITGRDGGQPVPGAVVENSAGKIYGQFYGTNGRGVGAVFHNIPDSNKPNVFGALAGVACLPPPTPCP